MNGKHKVKSLTTFTHYFTIGSLMLDDKEIRAAFESKNDYAEGQIITFKTKKEALDFCKYHGKDKFTYIGK